MKTNFKIILPSPKGSDNWTSMNATVVRLSYKSWLVVEMQSGQDCISEKSDLYSSPEGLPEEWINRDTNEKTLEITYRYKYTTTRDWFQLDMELDTDTMYGHTTVHAIDVPDEVNIYIAGVKVPELKLPKLPDIANIPGLYFYTRRGHSGNEETYNR